MRSRRSRAKRPRRKRGREDSSVASVKVAAEGSKADPSGAESPLVMTKLERVYGTAEAVPFQGNSPAAFPASPLQLHDDFIGAARDRVLQLVQIALDQIQSIDARLELVRQFPEQGSQPRVLELVELGDDEITLLAGPDEIDKIFQPLPPQAVVIDALRKHA